MSDAIEPLAGDPAETAIPRLVEQHSALLFNLGRRFCGSEEEAQDLVQDVFLLAWQNWDRFDGRSKAKTWLYTIAARACQRRHRKRSGEPEHIDSLDELLPGRAGSVPDLRANSWKHGHTGFSAHNAVTVAPGDGEGLERIGRYLLRPPVSVERMELAADRVHYRHKRAPYSGSETFDAEDFLARLLMHIPAPRLHQAAHYGAYASVVRARLRAATATEPQPQPAQNGDEEDPTTTAERRRLRRQWAQLIRRVYQSDPLTCRCGSSMRVISFLRTSASLRSTAFTRRPSYARCPESASSIPESSTSS